MITQDNIDEIVYTVEQVQNLFQDLTIGGLQTLGPERLGVIDSMQEEFSRIGAGHIAGHLSKLSHAIREGSHDAAGILMRAQASVRMFERILSLEVAEAMLATPED